MAFITKITNYIIDNYDLTKDFLTVIFPNKRAALTLRKELSKRIDKNIWLPQIMSIQEAMSSWSGIQLIDNIDIIYELIRIMNNSLDISTKNNIFGLASQIVKDFDEIDQYAADANKLFRYLKEVKEIESWSPDSDNITETESSYLRFFTSLNDYYEKLREKLILDKCGYYGMITRMLYELPEEKLLEVVGDRKIIFAGFNAMTHTEESVIVSLVESEKAVLLWDLDNYYFDDKKQEAGQFARHFFEKHNNIRPNFIEDNLCTDDKKINIISVSGTAIQAQALQLQLQEEYRHRQENTLPLGDEVVVLSDESLLIPVLNSIPEDYNGISITMGYPFDTTIVNKFIQQLFAFQKNIDDNDKKIYFWSLKRLLETEIMMIIFDKEELDSLSKSIEKLTRESTYYITADELENELKVWQQERLTCFIKELTKKWFTSSDCISAIKSLLIIMRDCLSHSHKSFIKNQIDVAGRILNKIDRLINKYDLLIQIDDIETLYKQSAAEMNIKLENNNLANKESCLQIMGLLETRNLDFDVVHILSVNEGILPQTKNANSLIPYDLRIEYKLPVYTNKQAVYAYHFYRLIQNAKVINIYYNNLTDDVGESEPSRFIRQLINEAPEKAKNIEIKEIIYKTPSPKISKTIEFEVSKTDEILQKIKERLFGVNKYGEIKGISPTSISSYLRCPMQFYLRYIANINNNTREEQIQSNIIGNIIHTTFELLYSKFGKGIINAQYYDMIVSDKNVEDAFRESIKKNNFAKGLPKTGFNYLTQIMIKELVNNFIAYERKFIKECDEMSVVGLEQNLFYTFDIDGTKVNLTGFADRIDKISDKVRIIDYKTGSVKENDVVIKKDSEHITDLTEKSLQLCIYKYLYAKNNMNVNIDDIEPGIYGLLKVSDPFFPLVNRSVNFDKDNFIDTCDVMFENLFKEILGKELPFRQTSDESNCNNCDFIGICKRNPKKYH